MRHHEFLSEDELFEINMSPSNLTKLVKDIPGARVGLEFEMIVPGAQVSDDGDYENDYDYDERARSFQGIYDFFAGGDGNNSRRDVQNLIDDLKEKYYDWASEKRWQQWMDEGWDYFVEYIEDEWDEDSGREDAEEQIRDENPEMDRDSEEYEELVLERAEKLKQEWLSSEWDEQGSNWDHARESWEDSADWPDEDDWLEEEGFRYMSDIERVGHDHDVYWPHQTRNDSSEVDIESVANEFGAAVGRPVEYSTSYHNINRGNQAEEGFYIIEPDGSLIPDDSSDEAGLEFVSPPLTIDEMMTDIKKVAAWAEERGAYTGKSNKTGLHMNVSVPGFDKDKLDFVKLALLLGDQHILKEFDRVSYTYAKSSFELLRDKIQSKPDVAEKGIAAMKKHFDMAASKAIHSGYTDKYTSINVKENRVEFRGPGGNYLKMFRDNPNKLFAPLMRFVVALEAACNPEKYRDEYQKKLFKFLSKAVKSKDTLELFTDYAAGKGFPQSAYKSFLKQRKSERELVKPGEGVKVGGRRSNPEGRWVLFRQHPTGHYNPPYAVEVLYRFNAANGKDAGIVRDQYVQEHKPSFQVLIASDPEVINGQPGDYEKNQTGNWGVYRKSDRQRMKYRGEYVIYRDRSKADAEEQLRALFATAHTTAQLDDYELRRLTKYEIYTKDDGRVVTGTDGNPIHFDASSPEEADTKKSRILMDFNIGSGNPDEYDVRGVLTPPAHTTTTTGERTAWQIVNQIDDRVVEEFFAPNRAHAVQKFQDFIHRAQVVGRNPADYILRIKGSDDDESDSEQPRTTATGEPQATASNGVPMWAIYRISDGEVVHRFADHVSSHTRTALSWLRDNGYNDNPSLNFRVRAMSQNEYSRERDPTAVQSEPQSRQWEIFNMASGQVSRTIWASTQDVAEREMERIVRAANMDPDEFDVRIHHPERQQPVAGSTQDIQQQRAQGGFTGSWKIVDSSGQELYRFSGVGNSQSDANRVAAQWIRDNPTTVYSGELHVVPVMGNQ